MLSSGTKRSAYRARQAFQMAAQSLSCSGSALGAFYRRLCARMDKPRANTATAHKLARMVYFMLTRGEEFVDQGQEHYEEQQRQRNFAALKRRIANAIGFEVRPSAASLMCRISDSFLKRGIGLLFILWLIERFDAFVPAEIRPPGVQLRFGEGA